MPAKRAREDGQWPTVAASKHAQRTTNPIRKIVDRLRPAQNPTKPLIALSIGDPTTDGNLLPPPSAVDAVIAALRSSKFNGYPPAVGYPAARAAVATYWRNTYASSNPDAGTLITPDTTILASGASHALLMAITAIANEGDNIVIPAPCFSLYGTICESYGIRVKHYQCESSKNWEVNIESLRSACNTKTRAILINNPSNPCGSNFSKKHLAEILAVAEDLKIPIISDEIYAGMVFDGAVFTSLAEFDTNVPRVIIGGIAKKFVVPGWRLGWLILMDKQQVATGYLAGMVQLSTLIVGPNSLMQSCLDQVLNHTDPAYQDKLNSELAANAKHASDVFARCPGLCPIQPQGAMYLMVRIDLERFNDIADGVQFATKLLEEENVQVLPGEIFQCPKYFRVVFTKPFPLIEEATKRVEQFCIRHFKK